MKKRLLIFTGKGGVGKTSVAAAHARKASRLGLKTLIVSTDMAHNLSDLFERRIGREEVEITQNLYALEVDPTYEMRHDFAAMMEAFENLMSFKKKEGVDSMELLEMFPGIEELFSLLKIQMLYEEKDYDLMIVDCAPTGETLSLLKLPELLSWYMEKLFPIGRAALRVVRPVSKTLFQLELPDGKAMNDIERFYLQLAKLQQWLKDQESCSVRLVTIPEKMVVEETKRNYMYMNLYGFTVDGVYVNRVLPREMENSFFDEWLNIQAGYIEELQEVFSAIPIYQIPWFDSDLNGLSGLDMVADQALCAEDLFAVRKLPPSESYEKAGEDYVMKLCLPCTDKNQIDMRDAGMDFIIKIGNVKRNIRKPDILRGYQVKGAKLEDGLLVIRFIREAEFESSFQTFY